MKLPAFLLGAFANKNFFAFLFLYHAGSWDFHLAPATRNCGYATSRSWVFLSLATRWIASIFGVCFFGKSAKFLLALLLNGPDLLGVC
jgi:hypothetical protein